MDSKTWLWKKRSSEKTIVVNGISDISLMKNVEQVSLDEKELILQESLDLLNDKLASIMRECDGKDELVSGYAKKAAKAVAGKEKAELEVIRLKEKLNEALQERVAENERASQLNAALKESMQKLDSVREEQEKRVCEAAITISKQIEKEHRDASAKLTNLTAENSHLKTALIEKEMLVRDLSKCKTQTEDELDVLMAKIDSMEKENVFLQYEFRMLEKELDACNEELAFSRYSLNASTKQNIDSSKKMKKLEEECQRLRGILYKRLPVPVASTKISREVEMQSDNLIQTRTTNLEPKTGGIEVRNSFMGILPGNPIKMMNMLIERLEDIEEENKVLKGILGQKDGDENYAISSYFRPSEVDSQLAGSYIFSEHVPSSKASSEAGKILSSQSSASSSLSELDQHEDSKNTFVPKMMGISDMSLMDDFLEMEKLTMVGAEAQPIGATSNSTNIGDMLNALLTTEINTNGTSTGKELVPVGQINLSDKSGDHQMLDISTSFDWIQRVLDIIMNQNHVSGRSLKELVEDVLVALREKKSLGDGDPCQAFNLIDQHRISGLLTWIPQMECQRVSSTDGNLSDEIVLGSHKIRQSNLGRSIHKIMELIRRLDLHCSVENVASLETSIEANDEIIYAFKWRKFEISAAINHFLVICDNMLEGKVNFEQFTEELASKLGLIMNSCVSIQETFSLKNEHLPERPQNKYDKKAALAFELQQSKESIRSVLAELETLEEVNSTLEDQIQNHKSKNQDLNPQLTIVRAKLSVVLQKLSSVEVELEERSHCSEEVEQKCLELQLQHESCIANQKTRKDEADPEGELTQSMSSASSKGREINAASAMLDECQEITLELGKQLKALASSKETNSDPKSNNKLSLLQQMQFEDTAEEENKLNFPNKQHELPLLLSDKCNTLCAPETSAAPQAIVLSKKRGGTIIFLKKLLYRRKRRGSRKLSFSLTS
ncbi:hypothetical protein LIER_19216 [Lithospermum erythrorhizon]|uniref:Filament-like plant protein 7 n=1 Tax=Lithospermum erythrorhizon TaxID=34254 RepID=A0AAV3QIF3_LITER